MSHTTFTHVRWITTFAGIGTGLTFIGHGALAAGKDHLWVSLFEGSLRFLPGGAPPTDTVSTLTQYIGIVDIIFGGLMLVLTAIMWRRSNNSFLPRTLMTLLWVAVFWQFMTSAAFVIAGDTVLPGFWQMIERAPSYLLPLLGVLAIKRHYLTAHRHA